MSHHSTSEKKISAILEATFWMVGALLSFTLMAVSVRELHGAIHAFEVQFFRSVGALIVLAPIIVYKGWACLKTQKPKLHLFRNLVHLLAQLGWISGLMLLPLAEVFAIEFTTPIWAALIAVLFLGEKLNRGRLTSIFLGFIGIVIIVRPGMTSINPGTLLVLAAAIGFALTLTSTKQLTKTEVPLTILIYMALIQLPIGAAMSSMVWVTPNLNQLFWLFAVGVVSLSAHYCSARALSLADATVVVPMDFMRLPLIILVGYLLYNESAKFIVILGATIIFAGNYFSIRYEQKLSKLRSNI
jgi:drug/metabolite transporter (DMT)-like permease